MISICARSSKITPIKLLLRSIGIKVGARRINKWDKNVKRKLARLIDYN